MYLRIVMLCVLVASCAANPTATPSNPAPPTTAVRSQTLTVPAIIAFPTRVAVPAITLAPDLTGPRMIVDLKSFNFNPSTIQARVGQPIRLELKNPDVLRHQFVIDNSDVDAIVMPGFSQRLDFVFSKPGTFVYACNLVEEGDHRSLGMLGTLIVEPAP